MIKSFQHKGLKAFFESGSKAGIQGQHAQRLRLVLGTLDAADCAQDMNRPGWKLHPLKGELDGYWSLGVSGNWRVIFRFIGSDIELVDYLDYH